MSKHVMAARERMDAATAHMELLANKVIGRLIRQGVAKRVDVVALRAGDLECRRAAEALAEVEAAHDLTAKTQESA